MIQELFHFSDFTTDHYRLLLREAKKNYQFSFYDRIDKDASFILWRHDLDFSIQRAYRIAQIEKEVGVASTYFVHLHNEYYNLFEKEISSLISKISEMGHQIGLHFDTHYYNIDNEDKLEEKLHLEKEILKGIFGLEVKAFSFHNTTQFTMGCQKWTYAGLINTYAEFFQKNVEYCSDSNGYWRFKRLHDVITKGNSQQLQILTHPEWWQEEIMSPWQRIQRCIDGRAENNKNYYREHLRKVGMKNIDWDGEVE